MNIMTNNADYGNLKNLKDSFGDLHAYIIKAAETGDAAHDVEKNIFGKMMELGKQSLGFFFELQGRGDMGETIDLGDDKQYKKLKPRTRKYKSVFGTYELERDVYGTYESQKIVCAPLDTRLSLPENEYSYLLQEWGQYIATEMSFEQSMKLLEKILPINATVDSLERINRSYDTHTEEFRETQEAPAEETEGTLIISTADGKGVPIKHKKDATSIEEHQHKKGPKPDRKRMAVVGSVYTIEPNYRTPEQVVESLFSAGKDKKESIPNPPKPNNKRVIANLTKEIDGKEISALTQTFSWMVEQVEQRNSNKAKKHIAIMDGQPSLWNELERQTTDKDYIEILDLLHATPRLWNISNIFCSTEEERLDFMKDRVLRVLNGEIKSVISGFRQMGTKRKLRKTERLKLERDCRYLEKNVPRMKYNEYLAQGLPIASGVIEGACRHFVKDRMERAGMQWTIIGAQAMLNVRSMRLNDDWDEFAQYRIKKEIERLYPHKDVIGNTEWPLAA